MTFYYILLGHLTGDFVLQTNRIAINKPLSHKWNVIHALIVTLCMLVFAIPFGSIAALLSAAAGFLHLLIDRCKPFLTEKYKIPELLAFITDQALHVGIIGFISLFAAEGSNLLFLDKFQVIFCVVLITVTFFAAISNQYILIYIFPRTGNEFFRKREKLTGVIIRFVMSLSIYMAFRFSLLFLLILPAAPVILFIYRHFNIKDHISHGEILVKLALDWAVSTVGACVLYFSFI